MIELKIQRWKPEAFLIGGEPHFNMLPTSKGDFILHDVAQVEFDRLTAQVEELKAALSETKCKLIEAATELNCYIDMKNADLELGIKCDDLDPPDYHDAQTVHESMVQVMLADELLTRIGEDYINIEGE